MVTLPLIGALAAAANAQNPQFEVASIKYNKAPNGDGSFTISPERLTANNTFLGVLIMCAYHIDQSQFPKLCEFSVSLREAFFRKQVAWIRRSPSGGQSAPATRPSHHGRLTLIASSARRKRVVQSRSGWR
jgi:hypothetical protein